MKKKQGSALAMALVFSVILLQFAAIYIMQVRGAAPQTNQIDERVKLRYIAQGMSELALLKFQKFPADFYNAWEHAQAGHNEPLLAFTNAPEFSLLASADQPISSFNNNRVTVSMATMTLATSNKWKEEVLLIRTTASYTSKLGANLTGDAQRTVKTTRTTLR